MYQHHKEKGGEAMPPKNKSPGSAEPLHGAKGKGSNRGGQYSTTPGPDNQAVRECHIVGLIALTPQDARVPAGKCEWLMILDGFDFPYWIWVTTDHLAIDGYPKFRRMVLKEGLDFGPISRREWHKIVGQAVNYRLGCWDASSEDAR